ncbi:MAG: hypothetical protein CVU61_01195 [Deltaproteobacteria bacterium HGW-Deltaproteobacteria-19]|jgi:purine-cytosine permease-like protein|nr:MAG: hypothetical protein CVU61_01195 [Deltaproteobacteria bacterium HGW-Deltaproteobacteria-19]
MKEGALWIFIAGIIVTVSALILASAESFMDVLLGVVPLVFVVVFGATYWVGRRRRRQGLNPLSEDLPDTDE